MFRKHTRHLQMPLTGHVDNRAEPLQERLQNSWTETFYWKCFCRLNAQPFAVPDVDTPSLPNEPVKVLVGVDLRTLYGFRERLVRHGQETDENLQDQVFAQVTDEQRWAFSLKTGKQRLDSTLLTAVLPELKARTGVETVITNGRVTIPALSTASAPVFEWVRFEFLQKIQNFEDSTRGAFII